MGEEAPAGACPLPDDRRYDVENDVWLKPTLGGRRAILGLTAPIVSFAGRFHRVEFRPVDDFPSPGRSVATVESTRYTGPVRLPIRGRILLRNALVLQRPKLLNDSPYDAGWLVEVEVTDPTEMARAVRPAQEARPEYARKISELRIRCLPAAPDVEMYEIGSECSAILARLDDEIARRAPDDIILLVTDDPTSPIEMVRWTDRTGHSVLHHDREGSLNRFLVRREAAPRPMGRPTPS
jgi:glycine cleavage system H protein